MASDLRILYEDRGLVVCVKPIGVLSQPSPTERDGDMLSLLQQQLSCRELHPIHRLDRAVGGVMVFAKTRIAAAGLSAAVADHSLQKQYLALLHGVPAAPAGELVDLLYHDAAKNRAFVVDRQRAGVKEARLRYRTLSTLTHPDGERWSLVLVQLLTGRTHQIRVQFSSRGLPLVGDGKYGAHDRLPIGLWSYRLCFSHPTERGKVLDMCCPPEADHAAFSQLSLPDELPSAL